MAVWKISLLLEESRVCLANVDSYEEVGFQVPES
jgi:hypothetical protein